MADNPAATYQLILEKVPEARQPDTALFLSGCFSLPPASTRGIAASGPIALLSEMTKAQAEAVLAELAPSLPAGVELAVVKAEERPRVSRLQWPRPPRIYGGSLDEFAKSESREEKCPICGGLLRITHSGGDVRLAVAGPDRRREGTQVRPAPPSSDDDPLFSGLKPLAPETSKYASIRSLQAGDTGFWMDHTHSIFAPAARASDAVPAGGASGAAGDTSNAKRGSGRSSAGLAAFMKPGAYAVVLARTREPQAVKMVSEIMGISESEARDRSQSLGLCVARDISLDEAQTLLARFRNLGARARVVRPS